MKARALFVTVAYGLVLCSASGEVRGEQANHARLGGERRERPQAIDNKSAASPQGSTGPSQRSRKQQAIEQRTRAIAA